MSNHRILLSALGLGLALGQALAAPPGAGAQRVPAPTRQDQEWRLAAKPPMPADNLSTPARVELGKVLFFDPRLSGNGAISCATCHNPALGWSDGLKTAIGWGDQVLGRATPTIVNTAYNTQFMWDGRKKSLEDQALGPMQAAVEMNTHFPGLIEKLRSLPGYVKMFEQAYPGQPIGEETIGKAIAPSSARSRAAPRRSTAGWRATPGRSRPRSGAACRCSAMRTRATARPATRAPISPTTASTTSA